MKKLTDSKIRTQLAIASNAIATALYIIKKDEVKDTVLINLLESVPLIIQASADTLLSLQGDD